MSALSIQTQFLSFDNFEALMCFLGFLSIESNHYSVLTNSVWDLVKQDWVVNAHNLLVFLAAIQNIEVPVQESSQENEDNCLAAWNMPNSRINQTQSRHEVYRSFNKEGMLVMSKAQRHNTRKKFVELSINKRSKLEKEASEKLTTMRESQKVT